MRALLSHLGPEGREFESLHFDHLEKEDRSRPCFGQGRTGEPAILAAGRSETVLQAHVNRRRTPVAERIARDAEIPPAFRPFR